MCNNNEQHTSSPATEKPESVPTPARVFTAADLAPCRITREQLTRRPPSSDFEDADNLPRSQNVVEGDYYTPVWVRGFVDTREGWCSLCEEDGQWLRMKNSDYWYHRQFHHGISSQGKVQFLPPLGVRLQDTPTQTSVLAGHCPACAQWVPLATRGNEVPANVWFRHAADCHKYNISVVSTANAVGQNEGPDA
ncbi:hypothetical protein T439DRAFT_134184 [Meredithblackwellia eburnea MCA 4105]